MSFSWPKTNLTWLEDNTLFLTLHGSRAFGTNTETSDEDFKGICVPPLEYYLGFAKRFEQAEFKKPNPDIVIYEIGKFFRLAAECNPSIVEVLFTDPADHVYVNWAMEPVLRDRDQFLSRKARHTFSGYAMSQLKRIKGHRQWLRNPPTHQPTREEFGLPGNGVMPQDQLMAAEAILRKDSLVGFDSNFLALIEKERNFRGAQNNWEHYQTWLATRNPERAALEAKVGYDSKHGMHLVRLMRMAEEILTRGEVVVKRPDAEELLEIRNGAWSFDRIVGWAEDMDAKLEEVEKTSPLPHAPDREYLDRLCRYTIEGFLDIGDIY
jgi:predicted nucleotidyltransferase